MPAQVGTDPSAFEEILRKARAEYGYIDILFQTNPELIKLLTEAVEGNYPASKFNSLLTSTQWFISNGAAISARIFSKNQYLSLMT